MKVTITMLGGFAVTVDDVAVPQEAWQRRHATALVKVLALARGRQLHREQVIDALWPGTTADAAAPRLHKAAHFARRALGGEGTRCVVLRSDLVALLPDADVHVDALAFQEAAEDALSSGSPQRGSESADKYTGSLLPGDLYEPWAEEHREALSRLYRDVLRLAGRWEELLREEPADEEAHLALVAEHAERGELHWALRQFERMDQALRRELGTAPSPAAEKLRLRLLAAESGNTAQRRPGSGTTLVGRRDVGDILRARLGAAGEGRGNTLLLTGPPGVGKSAVLELAVALGEQREWRVARGTASAVEGPWPYAPVLEALSDLSRRHPALLDGLDDNYRLEIDRALSASEVTWSGETAHQRLFLATAELVRLAAAGRGLLLVIDDVHEADEASLRLLHYVARCAISERIMILLAYRPHRSEQLQAMEASLVSRGIGSRLDLSPLNEAATRRLIAQRFPAVDEAAVQRIWQVSAGLPFIVLEMGRASAGGSTATLAGGLTPEVRRTFQRVALLGSTFTTDELLAVATVDEDTTYQHLESALAAFVVERAETGYRFRHSLVRDALLESMGPQESATSRREVAQQLAALGAAPARVAHQFLAAGRPAEAIPYVLPAVETAGALGAYRDALFLVDAVRGHAEGNQLAHLLARRGDLLMALADPESVAAYRDAVPLTTGTEHRLVRARLARAACFVGDFETARAALEGLDRDGDAADGPILLARGNLAYFTGDIDAAWEAASAARRLLLTPDDPWHYVDLVALQGLIAHQRGEWFERFRQELRRTRGRPTLATALFDAHLCVAEYLLYGPVPYAEVIELAETLRRRAGKAGALRGVAFATALIGEAALLMGDIERAERELSEAVDLHRDVDAAAGEAHCLQRLAEVRLAQGNEAESKRLLQRALPLARWSVISMHLLQRIYGTMIAAELDASSARVMVERAEDTLGETDSCPFCDVMLAVPAAIACADAGDLEGGARYLALAETSAARWEGSAWQAGVCEARAHLARARGERTESQRLMSEAARLFQAAGQVLDADRCTRAWQGGARQPSAGSTQPAHMARLGPQRVAAGGAEVSSKPHSTL